MKFDINDEDIEISIHCDIRIFDWLSKYIHSDVINEQNQKHKRGMKFSNIEDEFALPE